MKKVILFLILSYALANCSYAIRALDDNDIANFKNSLHLSKYQKEQIELIEKSASNAKKPLYEKLRNNALTNDKRKELYNTIYNIDEKSKSMTLDLLNKKQKERYIEFYSRVY